MALETSPSVLALLAATVLLAGVVNGVAGFGFALVGTMVLATALDPSTAVVVMILPILSVNLSLVGDLSAAELRRCGRRFGPLVAAALVGTVLGMALLERLPATPLRVGLGALTLGFVATQQRLLALPGRERVTERCFVERLRWMVALGGVSGLVFGGTNVGVQFVAYLRSRELSHATFVGVVAMVFLGLNTVRVGAAAVLGLYSSLTVVGLSVAATVPAVVGVAAGKRLRARVTEPRRRAVVLWLLTVVGIRLLASGL